MLHLRLQTDLKRDLQPLIARKISSFLHGGGTSLLRCRFKTGMMYMQLFHLLSVSAKTLWKKSDSMRPFPGERKVKKNCCGHMEHLD